MKVHEFTLILTAEPDDDQADALYGRFDDGTITTDAGTPKIDFHRSAPSWEEAIRSAISDVRAGGFEVARVEVAPDVLMPAN